MKLFASSVTAACGVPVAASTDTTRGELVAALLVDEADARAVRPPFELRHVVGIGEEVARYRELPSARDIEQRGLVDIDRVAGLGIKLFHHARLHLIGRARLSTRVTIRRKPGRTR